MEKFGIFELLDALSAMTAPVQETKTSPAAEQTEATESNSAAASPTHDAISSFLARHDAIAKKIDGK